MESVLQTILPYLSEALTLIQTYKGLSTLLLLLVGLGLKHYVVRRMRKRAARNGEDRRHPITMFKNISNVLLLTLLFVLWSSEIQDFALSIAAFMVAIVFATRELIQCFIGFIYQLSTRPFRVGDWIQIGDKVGEVVELDWAKFTLLEVDMRSYEYTGKHLYIPNNQLIIQTINNLNFLRRYALHTFTLTCEPDVDPFELIPMLIDRARHYCEHFQDVAQRYRSVIEKRLEIQLPGSDPSFTVTTNQFGKIELNAAIFCPTQEATEIEQKISADFMAMWFRRRPKTRYGRRRSDAAVG